VLRGSDTGRAAAGFAVANSISLVYGLIRPASLDFALAFLIAPSMAVMWRVLLEHGDRGRSAAAWLTWGTALGAMIVVTVNWLRG
jgi:hypothetical protein